MEPSLSQSFSNLLNGPQRLSPKFDSKMEIWVTIKMRCEVGRSLKFSTFSI